MHIDVQAHLIQTSLVEESQVRVDHAIDILYIM